ncbi:PilZ domain-containing protein [Magnetococcales bacterium HHB-1]
MVQKKTAASGGQSNKKLPAGAREVTGGQIVSALRKAHEEGSFVEIRPGGGEGLFFAHFWDHPPEPEEGSEDDDMREVAYDAWSYLNAADHIVLGDVNPPEALDELKKGDRLELLFFDGVKGILGEVRLMDKIAVDGRDAYTVSFPKSLVINTKRRHFRTPVVKELQVKLTAPFETDVIDISLGGLAFCYPADAAEMDLGSNVDLTLKIPPELQQRETMKTKSGLAMDNPIKSQMDIKAVVRNFAPAEDKGVGTPCEGQRCGVQFFVTGGGHSVVLGEVVNSIQREFLRIKEGGKKDQDHMNKENKGRRGDDEGGGKKKGFLGGLFGKKK